VNLRHRDRDEVGSTSLRTIKRYTRQLQAQGNIMMLESINQKVLKQLERTNLLDLIGEQKVYLAQPKFDAALSQSLADSEEWKANREG